MYVHVLLGSSTVVSWLRLLGARSTTKAEGLGEEDDFVSL